MKKKLGSDPLLRGRIERSDGKDRMVEHNQERKINELRVVVTKSTENDFLYFEVEYLENFQGVTIGLIYYLN